MQRERETGSLAPKPAVLPDNNKLDEAEMKHLAELIAAKPDMTLSELAAELSNKVSPPTVLRARRRLGLTRKKSRFMPQNKIVPT
jgi:transposase